MLFLLTSPLNAQPVPPSRNAHENASGRLLQLPPTRTNRDRSAQAPPDDSAAVQPASYSHASSQRVEDVPLPLRASGPQRLAPKSTPRASGKQATTTVLASLSVVLAAFFVLVWLSRKTAPQGLAPPCSGPATLGPLGLAIRSYIPIPRLLRAAPRSRGRPPACGPLGVTAQAR